MAVPRLGLQLPYRAGFAAQLAVPALDLDVRRAPVLFYFEGYDEAVNGCTVSRCTEVITDLPTR
ncbi:hypothetical protein [Arthrobacter sp. JCM 19049]|uniref:hypothetical protein n=1 Tax=Arthrobacter sp. JCM 19049 TaxID=1460643 RepID=UPI000AB36BF4|nr:hypothetical protein [Arthrobacter sp. JCM 19049]